MQTDQFGNPIQDPNAGGEIEYEDVYTPADDDPGGEGGEGGQDNTAPPAGGQPSPGTGAAPAGGAGPVGADQLTSLLTQDVQTRQQELEARRQEREAQQQAEQERINQERQRQRQQEMEQFTQGLLPPERQAELTAEQRQQYAQAAPFIEERANELLRQYTQDRLAPSMRAQAERMARLEAQLEEANNRTPQRPELDMDTRVSLLRPQVSTYIQSPEFAQFLDEATDDGVPRRMILQTAYQAGNTDAVVKMIDKYEERRGNKKQESPAPSSGVASAPSTGPKIRMLRQSDYDKAYTDYQLGKIDDAKMSDIEQKFELAYAEGRVDSTK